MHMGDLWSPEELVFQKYSETELETIAPFVHYAPKLFAQEDCTHLISLFERTHQSPVGVYGVPDGGKTQGSLRTLAWSISWREQLWNRMASFFAFPRKMDAYTPTDWFATPTRTEHRLWRAITISPLLRFMKYLPGGEHFGHYDMGYDYGDGRRTLVSFVLFLNDIPMSAGGELRFLHDGQEELPVDQRVFLDWDRRAHAKDIVCSIPSQCGSVVFFDHRLCHDVAPYLGQEARYVLRGDVVFRAE